MVTRAVTATPQSFALIANPEAGAGRARRRLPVLEARLNEGGAVFDTMLTSRPGHAGALAREALASGYGGVAVVGGDGTLNEALNGFFDERGEPVAPNAWIAPLPCGTGGDFRRTLELGDDPGAMVTRMLWTEPRRVDVGWLSFKDHAGADAHRAFINISSFGVGGLVDNLVNAGPKWMGGRAAFFMGTLRAMAQYRNRLVRITVDDQEPRDVEVFNYVVANGQFFGGGMHIAPDAKIDDGRFDLVSLEGLTKARLIRMTGRLYRGELLGLPGVRHERAQRVTAEPADWGGPVLLDVDGEAPGALPATFEIKQNALLLRA